MSHLLERVTRIPLLAEIRLHLRGDDGDGRL